jgi:diguanylate cyclase (GGDEF)-like protein/PAS domain S-box-containing protein
MRDLNAEILDSFKPFETFCKAMLDAYVVVNAEGQVLKANAGATAVTGMTAKQLLKLSSLAQALTMKIGQNELTTAEIFKNMGPTRIDDIKGRTSQGNELYLTIGYYPFLSDKQVIGAFMLIRDVTAETQLQGKYKDKANKSITDPLTGLFNRAHFEEYMDQEENRIVNLPHNSDHRNLSVIMGDIDHFKKINDKFGHPAGDYVIKTVAQILMKTVRKTDIVCRYGGEEFLVILPASDASGSQVAADKVRAAIEMHTFEFEGQRIPVTMSMGVAQLMVGSETGKDAIARADAALYSSKQNGRNKVSVHSGSGIISGPLTKGAA